MHIATLAYKVLGHLWRSFSSSVATKKPLYTPLTISRISYASSVWRPHLIKAIQLLEKIQRKATKLILNDFTSNYKTRLAQLNLLQLMTTLDLHVDDIFFFIKNYQHIQDCFEIKTWFKFSSAHTRSSTANKLTQPLLHFLSSSIPK